MPEDIASEKNGCTLCQTLTHGSQICKENGYEGKTRCKDSSKAAEKRLRTDCQECYHESRHEKECVVKDTYIHFVFTVSDLQWMREMLLLN